MAREPAHGRSDSVNGVLGEYLIAGIDVDDDVLGFNLELR
jgi:hypothetical protein